jgi:hypothetical protein
MRVRLVLTWAKVWQSSKKGNYQVQDTAPQFAVALLLAGLLAGVSYHCLKFDALLTPARPFIGIQSP